MPGALALVSALACVGAAIAHPRIVPPLAAQAAQAAAPQANRARPPISPARALFTSMIVPGLAQARLDRSTGLLFAVTEAVSLAMFAKSRHDYNVARKLGADSTPTAWVTDPQTGQAVLDTNGAPMVATWSTTRYNTSRIRARRTHVEDWVAALVFNHLFAGIDAFVAAQLWDLPANVEFNASPRGAVVAARVRW